MDRFIEILKNIKFKIINKTTFNKKNNKYKIIILLNLMILLLKQKTKKI